MANKFKLAYVLSHPIQYQSPLLQLLGAHPETDLHVYYLADYSLGGLDVQFGQKVKWDIPLLDGYACTFIKNISPKPSVSLNFFGLINPALIRIFTEFKPDYILVNGWAYLSDLYLLLLAKAFSVPVLIRGESPANQESGGYLKQKAKTLILSFCHKYLYIGNQNKKFYQQFGIKETDLVFTPYCVDNDRFKADYLKLDRAFLRQRKGMTSKTVAIVTVGKYIIKKRPLDLILAFAKLKKRYPAYDLRLVFVGSGELQSAMEQQVENFNLSNCVEFTGFVNQSMISEYYRMADIFVLPSGQGETWGLVVNEAMNFHLPVVVSDVVGCVDDLVLDGITGFRYPCGQVEALSSQLEKLILNEGFRMKMGYAAANHIQRYSYQNVIAGIKSVMV